MKGSVKGRVFRMRGAMEGKVFMRKMYIGAEIVRIMKEYK
jgi:hypothetical protein